MHNNWTLIMKYRKRMVITNSLNKKYDKNKNRLDEIEGS